MKKISLRVFAAIAFSLSSICKTDAKQQALVNVSALTANGDTARLREYLNKRLDAGLTVNEVEELLVHRYAYCGFPRSLTGLASFMKVVDDRKAGGKKDAVGKEASPVTDAATKYRTGRQTFQTLSGREEKAPSEVNAFAPVVDTFLKEHLFADIFSRDVLTYVQRELATIAALAGMTGVAPQLQAHIGTGLNTGLTKERLTQAFSMVGENIGKKEERIAKETLQKVLSAN